MDIQHSIYSDEESKAKTNAKRDTIPKLRPVESEKRRKMNGSNENEKARTATSTASSWKVK